MNKTLPAACAAILFPLFSSSHPYGPAAGAVQEGEYRPLYVADPYILYDGQSGIYYAYGTTAPDGFKAYVSTDMAVWEEADTPLGNGYVLRKNASAFGNGNFWAPEIWKIRDRYYMLYSADYSLCIAESDSPLGPFTQPDGIGRLAESAIDHTLFTDKTGDMYLFFSSTRDGRNSIYMAGLSDDMRSLDAESDWKLCLTTEPGTWEEVQNQIIEGPFVLEHGGKWYLTYSANDYRSPDYSVGYAISDDPVKGGWKKYSGNPVLHGIGKLSGTGHSSFFTGYGGQLYIVFHAHHSDSTVDPRKMYVSKARFDENGVLMIDDEYIEAVIKENTEN